MLINVKGLTVHVDHLGLWFHAALPAVVAIDAGWAGQPGGGPAQ